MRRQNTLGWAQHRKPTTQIVAQYRKRGDDNGTDRIRSKCVAANELLEALLAAQDLHSWLQERLPNRLDCHPHKHTHTHTKKNCVTLPMTRSNVRFRDYLKTGQICPRRQDDAPLSCCAHVRHVSDLRKVDAYQYRLMLLADAESKRAKNPEVLRKQML